MTELNNKMTFDEAYKALEETVREMETPGIQFKDSLRLYEQACKLVVYCQRKLADAKGQVTEINERVRKLKETNAPLFED